MKRALKLIADERQRQIDKYGYTDEHILAATEDYDCGELALAAACYCEPSFANNYFPWSLEYFKPSPENRIKELVKAAAMLVEEIERLHNL